jgi:hypothetical protein
MTTGLILPAVLPDTPLCVDVVMVGYFTGSALYRSLPRALEDKDIGHVVLVDNGNDRVVRNWLDELVIEYDTLTVIEGHGNIGFSRGCNLGARVGTGDHILFLNPDAVIEPGAVRHMVETLTVLPAPALVGARLLNTSGDEQRGSRRGVLTASAALVALLRIGAFLPHMADNIRIHREGDPVSDGPVDMPTVSGAAFMMRRTDYQAIGGLDEGYFLHVEDIDICKRVRDAGGRVVFDPRARVVHYGSTSRANPLFIEWHKGWGFARYFFTHARTVFGRLMAVILAPAIVCASLVRPILRPLVRLFRKPAGMDEL